MPSNRTEQRIPIQQPTRPPRWKNKSLAPGVSGLLRTVAFPITPPPSAHYRPCNDPEKEHAVDEDLSVPCSSRVHADLQLAFRGRRSYFHRPTGSGISSRYSGIPV